MIERAEFGRTGHLSSRVIFGAAALSSVTQDLADHVLATVTTAGVNHLDTAASYGDAELRLAPLLARRRDDFFLATKTAARGGDAARAELERSLARLGVGSVDLIQLHNLVEPDEFEAAFAPDGCVAALVAARDEGLVRFIGVTGHGMRIAAMHRRSLERFDFDSVLLPYNFVLVQDQSYRRDVEELLAICAERSVAVQTIKSIARRRWPSVPSDARSWYEPLEDDAAIGRAVRYVLGVPQLFLNSSSDFSLLSSVLAHAQAGGDRPSDDELAADVARYEIAPLFDGLELERI
jgi:aryl-alcohol dehydrogenase-like predicted oxidoreductase